jgi:hypothetical protein
MAKIIALVGTVGSVQEHIGRLRALPSTVCSQTTGSAPAIRVATENNERIASDDKRAFENSNGFKDRLLLRLAPEMRG